MSDPRQRLEVLPSSKHECNHFIKLWHRHNKTVAGGKIFLKAIDETGVVRGVCVVGRPSARMLDDGLTVEITRCATDGCQNANSALYGRARRVAQAYGFRRVLTYTLQEESGASMRGAGFVQTKTDAGGGSWARKTRPRPNESHVKAKKVRWEAMSDPIGIPAAGTQQPPERKTK